jgi:hypothetical protein
LHDAVLAGEKIRIMKKKHAKAKARAAGKTKTAKKARSMLRVRKAKPSAGVKKVVRIMGQGQFYVDAATVKKLNSIDDSLVELVASENGNDGEFRAMLAELNHIAAKRGKPVERGEIVRSDIILPSADLPVDEAKKLFMGEGVIPN